MNVDRSAVTAAELRLVRLFADLADDELAWIAEHSEMVTLTPGEVFFSSGEPAVWMLIALEGTLQAKREHLGASAPAFVFRAGDVAGVIPFSRMTSFTGTGRALTHARMARFPKAGFDELLRRIPVLKGRFVSLLADRVRDATRRDAQFEKLTALGKLAAGLAHELNNPAAAAQRSAAQARQQLDAMGRLMASLTAARVTADAVIALDALRSSAVAGRSALPALDAVTRADREETLAAWLGEAGVRDPWISAASFVEAGIDEAALARAMTLVPSGARVAALAWLAAGIAADALLATIEGAAARISHLVGAVKAYTNMDRAREMEDVDLSEGLESTLSMLAHRIRDKQVRLVRDFAPTLPKLRAYPGDLNQVWTNLIDNAIDAVAPGTGCVAVRTAAEDGSVCVEIRDNGPGVPEELRDRIWEPFFTTKDVGQGTGLGLDIARRIVADQHGGQLSLASVPGDTRFTVHLPLTTATTFGA